MLGGAKASEVAEVLAGFPVFVSEGAEVLDAATKFVVLMDPDNHAETHVLPDHVRNFPRALREVLTEEELESAYQDALSAGEP